MAVSSKAGTPAERVRRILAEQAGLEVLRVIPENSLRLDLGFDSLDEIEAVMAIEEDFGIVISDETSSTWRTVADVLATVEALATKPAPAISAPDAIAHVLRDAGAQLDELSFDAARAACEAPAFLSSREAVKQDLDALAAFVDRTVEDVARAVGVPQAVLVASPLPFAAHVHCSTCRTVVDTLRARRREDTGIVGAILSASNDGFLIHQKSSPSCRDAMPELGPWTEIRS